jgi:hypothetical protein
MNLRPIIQETTKRLAALRAAVTATIQSQTCNSCTADVVISVLASALGAGWVPLV